MTIDTAYLKSLFKIADVTPRTAEFFRDTKNGKRFPYSPSLFAKDCLAGLIVAVVALPLSMAFSIAAGGTPAQGLYTAIIAGFVISALGGSRFQIGGPTGAFVVIIFNVIARYGMPGLAAASLLAGLILALMGLFGLGRFIKYIPYPVTTGFTAGIGLIIFSQQIKDFFGLALDTVPPEFLGRWANYIRAFPSADIPTLAAGLSTIVIIAVVRRFAPRVPSAAVGVLLTTVACYLLGRFTSLPLDSIETIQSRFGGIPSGLPRFEAPPFSLGLFTELFPSAFSIALLAAIESLLSAVVADGMSGDRHNSNTELFAQGLANIASSLFGGIPATGAIARTATNIKAGAVSPVAGMVHALALLLFVLCLSGAASLIPLASLSGVLIVVAWDMSGVPRFIRILRTAPKSDSAVLITTFALTVLVDLSYAVVIGVLMAVFLFLRRMIEIGDIQLENDDLLMELAYGEVGERTREEIRVLSTQEVLIYEISGPFFFGVADMLQGVLLKSAARPRKIVLRMRAVPAVDSTGIAALESFLMSCRGKKISLALCECRKQPLSMLKKSGFGSLIYDTLDEAIGEE